MIPKDDLENFSNHEAEQNEQFIADQRDQSVPESVDFNGFKTMKINKPKSQHPPGISDNNEFNIFQVDDVNHIKTDNNIENLISNNVTKTTCNNLNTYESELFNNQSECGFNEYRSNDEDTNDNVSDMNEVNYQHEYGTESNNLEHSKCTDLVNCQIEPQNSANNEEEISYEEEHINSSLTENSSHTIASLSLALNLGNDSFTNSQNSIIANPSNNLTNSNQNNCENFTSKNATGSLSSANNMKEQNSPSKPLMKDLNKEERLRLIREKHEQELAKKKKELEENLKRKQELYFKQQKEKQKRIDEYKLRENEKRLACEERRRKREETERNRLNEFLKREQERAKLASKPNMKGSEWTLNTVQSSNNSNNHTDNVSDDTNSMNSINKSQSAYNLSLRKKDLNGLDHREPGTLSKRLANSTLRLAASSHQKNSASESIVESSELAAKRRSRTVPTTPLHNKKRVTNNNENTHRQAEQSQTSTTSNFRNQLSKMMNNNQNSNNSSTLNSTTHLNKSLYWEGPPAHFMLPTHAIHCRLSRSVERCPRACKATAEAIAAEEAAYANSQKPLQTIAERNKPLSAHLQQTINRLSMPKKQIVITEENMNNTISNHHVHNHHLNTNSHRSATPQPNKDNDTVNNHNSNSPENLTANTATSSSNSISINKKPKLPATPLKKNIKSTQDRSVNSKKNTGKITNGSSISSLSHSHTSDSIDQSAKINKSSKIENLKIGARKKALGHSSSNGSIVSLNTALGHSKKSNSNSTLSLQSKSTRQSNQDDLKTNKKLTKPKKTTVKQENTSSNVVDSNEVAVESIDIDDEPTNTQDEVKNVIEDIKNLIINDVIKQTEKNEIEKIGDAQENAEVEEKPDQVEVVQVIEESKPEMKNEDVPIIENFQNDNLVIVDSTPNQNLNRMPTSVSTTQSIEEVPTKELTEEELYKIKLEEKRREAREKAAREEELIRLEEERKRKEEEEQERLAEEEFLRLNQLAREQEEERLRIAMELNERLENERKIKEENERKLKEENERKAKEEAEKAERERLEKIKKEEEERLERKKKIDLIMRRVHNKEDNSQAPSNTSNQTNGSNNSNLLMSASNNDLTSIKSMTSSFTSSINNNDNNSPLNSSSMTTSMINPPVTDPPAIDQQRFKTPLLQSILSKTRITTILNKYADDPLINNPTLSLIAQNSQSNVSKENDSHINTESNKNQTASNRGDRTIDRVLESQGNELDESGSAREEVRKRDEITDKSEEDYELQLTEVNVVVENSSSASSSPSSPGSIESSVSSRSSQQASPPASNAPAPTPSHTQISA